MPDFLQPLFGNSTRTAVIFWSVLGGVGFVTLLVLWQVFGGGPQRRRGLNRARRRLAEGAWGDALELIRKLRNRGSPSAAWKKRFNEAEAECLKLAAKEALQAKQFEDALAQLLRAAQLLGESPLEAKRNVQSAMLEEIRRLFAATTLGETRPAHDLIAHALQVQSPCREASFWQGLAFLRGGEPDRAMEALQTARTGHAKALATDGALGELPSPTPVATPNVPVIEPSLYLGAMLLRQGQAKESLRYLTEANRIDGNCPIVTLQLGAAMIGAGGDTHLAVRALQRALGPKGLQMWSGNPQKAWVEGFPEGRSYIRRLAAAHPFDCPLWGKDLGPLIQQGNLALGQGLYKLGAYPEAADLFAKVLENGAPSLTVLRGLGLALARLGKYDDAFKHLRSAHEMEEPKDRVTAGYLALCGAKGKPTRPEDKAKNIVWAIRVVTRFNAPADQEWVALIGALFAEARAEKIPQSLDDQLYLCEHLLSVQAADPQAAAAYHHLQATYPEAMHCEYAWLYCRAAQQHKMEDEHALELFARTFAEKEAARAFFATKGWDFDEVEFTYLDRAATLAPGQFPAALGPDYPPLGESLLLARSEKLEESDQPDDALAAAEILAKLAPSSPRAFDRLAYLHHRRGQPDQAVHFLETWHHLHPGDALPLVRFAVLLAQHGNLAEAQNQIREAMALCAGTTPPGPPFVRGGEILTSAPREGANSSSPPCEGGAGGGCARARIAFLGARLTLHHFFAQPAPESNGPPSPAPGPETLAAAQDFLEQCLLNNPAHPNALWFLAAVRWLRGDLPGLSQQAAAMSRAEVADPRFHFFAGLCRLAGGDFSGVIETCKPALAEPSTSPEPTCNGAPDASPPIAWPMEYAYLVGLAHLGLEQYPAAVHALMQPAQAKDSPSAAHAQALLGAVHFHDGRFEEAARWWQILDPKKRAPWKLGETLANTVFLTALEAYAKTRFEEAAEKLRAAGKLGCRDRRLGPLLVQALFKAGQKLVYADVLETP